MSIKSYFHIQAGNRDSSKLPTSRHGTVGLLTDGYKLTIEDTIGLFLLNFNVCFIAQ